MEGPNPIALNPFPDALRGPRLHSHPKCVNLTSSLRSRSRVKNHSIKKQPFCIKRLFSQTVLRLQCNHCTENSRYGARKHDSLPNSDSSKILTCYLLCYHAVKWLESHALRQNFSKSFCHRCLCCNVFLLQRFFVASCNVFALQLVHVTTCFRCNVFAFQRVCVATCLRYNVNRLHHKCFIITHQVHTNSLSIIRPHKCHSCNFTTQQMHANT
jgi:hypothetical protein